VSSNLPSKHRPQTRGVAAQPGPSRIFPRGRRPDRWRGRTGGWCRCRARFGRRGIRWCNWRQTDWGSRGSSSAVRKRGMMHGGESSTRQVQMPNQVENAPSDPKLKCRVPKRKSLARRTFRWQLSVLPLQ